MKIPIPKSAACRLRPTSAAAASAPSRPPMPTAELRKPTPDLPVSSSFRAITTMSTFSIPSTNVCAEKRATSRRSRRSRTIVRKPASSSSTMDTASSRSASSTSATGRMPMRRNADQSTVPAVTRNTSPGPLAARSRPPSAGPPKIPTLSIVLAATLAAVSSSGVRASEGIRAASAGRKAVAATPTRPAMM